jgi:hypothetical protein
VGTSLSPVVLLELEAVKGVHSGGGLKNYVTSLAAVTTVRSPFGYVFLTPKTQTTVAAVPRLYGNLRFVNKLHCM